MSAARDQPPTDGPRVWLILGDKLGDNAQIELLADRLGLPVERKVLLPRPRYVRGKPFFRPTVHHIDWSRSSRLEPPWPDLAISIGRRPTMAAMWMRRRSGGRTRLVLLGRPRRRLDDFALVIAPSQFRVREDPRVLRLALPLMRPDPSALEAARERFAAEWSGLPRPLTAILVGGQTHPFRWDAPAARSLVDAVRRATGDAGTLYFTTSRRTPAAAVEALRAQLPERGRLFAWRPDAEDNPYPGLLALADRFVVTGDSASMMVEVARLGRPLAIHPPPLRWPWLADAALRLGRGARGPGWDAMPRDARRASALTALLGNSRDLTGIQRALIGNGLAVWLGSPFHPARNEAPDEAGRVVEAIRALLPPAGGDADARDVDPGRDRGSGRALADRDRRTPRGGAQSS